MPRVDHSRQHISDLMIQPTPYGTVAASTPPIIRIASSNIDPVRSTASVD